jgi:hypothetical protein
MRPFWEIELNLFTYLIYIYYKAVDIVMAGDKKIEESVDKRNYFFTNNVLFLFSDYSIPYAFDLTSNMFLR